MINRPRYQRLVGAAKEKIKEVSAENTAAEVERGDAVLIDVRETEEWDAEHARGAMHLSRGMLEVEIEEKLPDFKQPIILHCGAGGRSALAAASLQEMGYENVRSMAGGLTAWKEAGLPTTKD